MTPSPPRASSPRRTRRAASTASTSRPRAPAARPTPPPAPPTGSSSSAPASTSPTPRSATSSRSPARSPSSSASPRSPRRSRRRRGGRRPGPHRPGRPLDTALPDHDGRQRRRTRASCSRRPASFTVTNTLQHQQLRRDRPGHRRQAADRSRPRWPTRRTPLRCRPSRPTTRPVRRPGRRREHQLPRQRRPPGHPRCRGSPPTNSIRVGRRGHAHAPVVLDFRNNAWKFQPQQQVTGQGADGRHVREHPADNAAPQRRRRRPQARHLQRAELLHHHGRGVRQRQSRHLHLLQRPRGQPHRDQLVQPERPSRRGQRSSFERQQAKIVTAINALDADIVALEEIENSAKLSARGPRLRDLAASSTRSTPTPGAGTWAFAPTPPRPTAAAGRASRT